MTLSRQFHRDLDWSHEQHQLPWWQDVYRQAFPTMVSNTVLPKETWGQQAGRDRAILLEDSSVLYIDEKARRKTRDDILIEVAHEYRSGRVRQGWIHQPLGIDYLAYAFVPAETCYLLPFRLLQQTWQANKQAWWKAALRNEHGFRLALAQNRDYVTKSVAVPIWTLLDAMRDAMVIHW